MLLSRNEILATDDRPTQRVSVPELGAEAEVLVRMMSSHNREIYENWAVRYSEQRAQGMVESQELYALMAVLSCCDEQGAPLFTLDDVPWLAQKAFTWLKRIFDAAWKLNLFDPGEVEKAADFFDSTQDSDSGFASPSPLGDAPSENSNSV